MGLAEVNEYLTDLTNLRLLEVVSESSEAVDLRRYGLNRPVAELRIVTEEGGEPEVLTFSSRATQADPNNIYVTSSHFGFIGRLYASVLENVDVPRSKFFNRAFPFRQIAVEQVHEVKFQGVEELGVVTGEPARSLAEELKKNEVEIVFAISAPSKTCSIPLLAK